MSPRRCTTCGAVLNRRNRSGLCRKHVGARVLASLDADARKRQRLARNEALRRFYAANPQAAEERAERMRAITRTPEHARRTSERMARDPIWIKGVPASHTPQANAKRGRSLTERALGWCPPAWRDEYRRMLHTDKLTAAEARAVIENHMAAQLRRRISADNAKREAEA